MIHIIPQTNGDDGISAVIGNGNRCRLADSILLNIDGLHKFRPGRVDNIDNTNFPAGGVGVDQGLAIGRGGDNLRDPVHRKLGGQREFRFF